MAGINFPLSADLTKSVEDFDLKSEVTKVNLQSKAKNSAITAWKYGEWLVYNGTDIVKPTTTAVRNSFCTFTKPDVYDVAATSKLDLIMGPHYAMTKNFQGSPKSYAAGSFLVVKLVSSYGVLTPATTGEELLVVGVALNNPANDPNGYLEYLAY